jgi:hypothetical protein
MLASVDKETTQHKENQRNFCAQFSSGQETGPDGVQTGSGAYPISCRMGTGNPFRGGKLRGSDADDLSQFSLV